VWEDEGGELRVPVFQFSPTFSDLNPNAEEVCLALCIQLTVMDKDHGPIVLVSTSRSKFIVQLTSREILDRIEPGFEMLWNLCDQKAIGVTYTVDRYVYI